MKNEIIIITNELFLCSPGETTGKCKYVGGICSHMVFVDTFCSSPDPRDLVATADAGGRAETDWTGENLNWANGRWFLQLCNCEPSLTSSLGGIDGPVWSELTRCRRGQPRRISQRNLHEFTSQTLLFQVQGTLSLDQLFPVLIMPVLVQHHLDLYHLFIQHGPQGNVHPPWCYFGFVSSIKRFHVESERVLIHTGTSR